MIDDQCDVCEEPWNVKFEWSYTGPERYCERHMLEPIEGQPGKTLLDYMPDCQHISHRIDPKQRPGHVVRHTSTNMLQVVMTSRLP